MHPYSGHITVLADKGGKVWVGAKNVPQSLCSEVTYHFCSNFIGQSMLHSKSDVDGRDEYNSFTGRDSKYLDTLIPFTTVSLMGSTSYFCIPDPTQCLPLSRYSGHLRCLELNCQTIAAA